MSRVKKILKGLVPFFVFVLIITGVEWKLKHCRRERSYYLPAVNFWKLGNFTSLFGVSVHQGELTLFHTGVGFSETVKLHKPAGVKRVVMLGTSSTEGYGVAREYNYPSVLQQLCDGQFGQGKVEVINAGVGGYVSYQLLIYFKQVLLQTSPDILVVYLGHNDSNYSGRFTSREYYEKVAAAAIKHKGHPFVLNRIARYGLAGINTIYPLFGESRIFGYFVCKLAPFMQSKIKLKMQCPPDDQVYVLKEFVRLCRQQGVTLLFVPEAVDRVAGSRVFNYHMLMSKIAKENAVTLVNVLPELRKYPDSTIFLDRVHFTIFGNKLVAQLLFGALLAPLSVLQGEAKYSQGESYARPVRNRYPA